MSSAKSIDPDLLRNWTLPDPGDSKDDRGSAFIVGGGHRSPGAVILSAEAALRSGCGRVMLATGPSSAAAAPIAIPESGVILLGEDERGHIRGSTIAEAEDDINAATGILVGPGLDDVEETVALLDALLRISTNSVPMVWDAFAIGALASFPELGERADQRLILTPNKAELARLIRRDTSNLERDVQEAAERYRAVVSCYGFVAEPGGALWKSPGTGPGLGTAGSGDVRAGITVGLAARGADRAQASVWASYLHAQAGSDAAAEFGPINYLAHDLLAHIGRETVLRAD